MAGGDISRFVRLRDLVLGFEGLALLRGLLDGTEDEMAARIDEIRTIAAAIDDEPYAIGVQINELDPRAGYAASAAGYDAPGNPLIDVEQPVVEAIVSAIPAGRALDAACGTGRHARHLAAKGHEVFGTDGSPEMLAVAREAVPGGVFEVADLREIPFEDASFDLVTCALAICHLPDIGPACSQLARVAKPGAKVVISDPHPTSVSILSQLFVPMQDGTMGFVRNHPRRIGEYLEAFEAAGLRVVRCHEPPMPETAVGGLAARFVPGAMRQALVGLPGAIVWELERV